MITVPYACGPDYGLDALNDELAGYGLEATSVCVPAALGEVKQGMHHVMLIDLGAPLRCQCHIDEADVLSQDAVIDYILAGEGTPEELNLRVIKLLRDAAPGMPIIATSAGLCDKPLEEAAKEAGANEFYCGKYSPEVLAANISQAVHEP